MWMWMLVWMWCGCGLWLGGQSADAGAETRGMGAPDWLAETEEGSTSCVW
jgi:hypothetical protein